MPRCAQLSLHRRGQRRQWYHLKRTPEVQHCPFCDAAGPSNSLLVPNNTSCTGQCLANRPQKQYQPDYKPPC